MKEERKKIYETNPDTGQVRWRYVDESPDDYGWPNYGNMLNKSETWGKLAPTPPLQPLDVLYSPDAPWIDERVNENKSGQLLNEDENDEQEDRQLSFPFE